MIYKLKTLLILLSVELMIASCGTNEFEDVVTDLDGTATLSTTSTSDVTLLSTEGNNNLLFEESFEGNSPFSTAHNIEVGNWDYALQYVNSPVYRGNKAARFEIREDQPLVHDGKRAEVTIVKGSEGDITKNTWYSFAAYFPADGFARDSQREIINQWYQSGSPATSLRIDDDRIILETGNETGNRKQIDLGFVTKDVWHEFVFHFIHSHGSDGLIEVWHNGTKLLTHTGGNMYDNVLPKWKVGLYKSAFKHGTSDVDKRVIYYDNIRVGNQNATFADMTSGSKPGPTPDPIPEPKPEPKPDPIPEPKPDPIPEPKPEPIPEPTPDPIPEPTPDPTLQSVVSFTLVDASTEQDVMTIVDGATLDLSSLGIKKMNIRANTNSNNVGNVQFVLSGEESKYRTDDVIPYALFGDDRNGNYYSWYPEGGSYTLEATIHEGDKGDGGPAIGSAYSISFTIKK